MAEPDIPERIGAGDVALRTPCEADVGAIVDACQDPEIPRWTCVPSPYGPVDARRFVSRAENGRRRGDAAVYLIVDRTSDRLLGSTGLIIERHKLTAELGYWLAASARGRGVASQATAALVEWGFSTGLCRIQAHVLMGNDSSCRLLSRVGFVEEGVLRSLPADNCGLGLDRVDMHLFSQIRSDRSCAPPWPTGIGQDLSRRSRNAGSSTG